MTYAAPGIPSCGEATMIKKFFSNALLSVVMDKKARDKINALQDSKSQPAPAETEAASDMDIPRFLPDKGDQPKAAKHNRPPHIPPHRPPAVEEEDPGKRPSGNWRKNSTRHTRANRSRRNARH